MSIEKIHLRKLLQLFFADPALRRKELKADIRLEAQKKKMPKPIKSGGDFYSGFWADVKKHAAGSLDITEATRIRIEQDKKLGRLYPILRDSFLKMWQETMKWRNEPFEFVPQSISAHLEIDQLKTIVKIENTVAIKTWDDSHRIIYPYFCEFPQLPKEGVQIAFWVLTKSLPDYDPNDFRVVDMQHGKYYRMNDVGMNGDEEEKFLNRYKALLSERKKLEIGD